VTFKLKSGGGLSYNSTVKQTQGFDEKMMYHILHDYKIHNADVLLRQDITVDEFIDVVLGNRKYIRCLYVYNKIDSISLETVDELAHRDHAVVISCALDLNLDTLKDRIWSELGLIRVYTKRKGELPGFSEALILREGSTVEQACDSIHRTLSEQFRYGLVWGQSAKHKPQRVGLTHVLAEGDVLSIITK
jgi:ribosome-interacting GTPase 1